MRCEHGCVAALNAMNLHVAVLLVYAAILMGIGLWIGRRVRNSSDFFVAGRRLGPSLLFSTMLAAYT